MTKTREETPTLKILRGAAVALGPGKLALLEVVDRTGSITGAAREMGMSYRRAWDLVETMTRCFREPLVETVPGGKGGGGAQVTPFGREVVRRYRAMEVKAARSVATDMKALEELMS